MLTKQARAELRWPIANHQPATRNQSTLPISPSGPVPRSPRPLNSSRFTASCPNGQSENLPITKQERAQGSPMIVIAHSSPASHQPRAITKPPSTTQRMLSRALIMVCWWWRRGSWTGLADREQGGVRFGDEGLDRRGVSEQNSEKFCCAGVTHHEPDHFWRCTSQQAHAAHATVSSLSRFSRSAA